MPTSNRAGVVSSGSGSCHQAEAEQHLADQARSRLLSSRPIQA